MTFYKQVPIDITRDQLMKAFKMLPIQLSRAQVAGSGSKLFLHPENFKKIMASKMKGSGCRIQISPDAIKYDLETMKGGSVWNFLKNTLWPVIKPAVSGVLDAAVAPVASALGPYGVAVAPIRQGIRTLTGVGVNGRGKKGSPEMKEKMARLRAMRKTGAGFRLN